jgi:hypothetical protein
MTAEHRRLDEHGLVRHGLRAVVPQQAPVGQCA